MSLGRQIGETELPIGGAPYRPERTNRTSGPKATSVANNKTVSVR